jgi:hypothetical protein
MVILVAGTLTCASEDYRSLVFPCANALRQRQGMSGLLSPLSYPVPRKSRFSFGGMVRSFVVWLSPDSPTGKPHTSGIDVEQRVNDVLSEKNSIAPLAVADFAAGSPLRADCVQRHRAADGRTAPTFCSFSYSYSGNYRWHSNQDDNGCISDNQCCRRDGAARLGHTNGGEYTDAGKHADCDGYPNGGKHAHCIGGKFSAGGAAANRATRHPHTCGTWPDADGPWPAGTGAAGRDEPVGGAGQSRDPAGIGGEPAADVCGG